VCPTYLLLAILNSCVFVYIDKKIKSKKFNLKPQSKPKAIKENRINYRIDGEDISELYDSLTLFQKLLRGRAYQTMVQDFSINIYIYYFFWQSLKSVIYMQYVNLTIFV